MANAFNTSQLVVNELAATLHASGTLINTVDKSLVKDFQQKKYRSGETVEFDIEPYANVVSGRVAQPQEIGARKSSITLGQYNSSREWTSMEKGWSMAEVKAYARTMGNRIVREMERTGFEAAAKRIPHSVGSPGVEPGSMRLFADARAKLMDHLCPDDELFCAITPMANAALWDSIKGLPNPSQTIGNAFTKGRLKEAAGIGNFYVSNSIYRHTAGTADNTTPLVDGAISSDGLTTLHIDGTTNGDIVTASTKFTIGVVGTATAVYAVDPETKERLSYLREFTVTATSSASAGSGDVDLTIYPPMYGPDSPFQNCSQLPPDGAEIVFKTEDEETASCNLIYHPKALTLASVPLPESEMKGIHKFANFDGIQLRVGMYPPDGRNDTELLRIDAVWGWGVLHEDHASIVWGA